MVIIWRARTRFSLEQAWFLKLGSNDGGIGELSLYFKIKISVGIIISRGDLVKSLGFMYVKQPFLGGY
jgi:hypothetical protein